MTLHLSGKAELNPQPSFWCFRLLLHSPGICPFNSGHFSNANPNLYHLNPVRLLFSNWVNPPTFGLRNPLKQTVGVLEFNLPSLKASSPSMPAKDCFLKPLNICFVYFAIFAIAFGIKFYSKHSVIAQHLKYSFLI